MHLVPFIKHGSFGIVAHPAAAHLVDIQARRLFGVVCFNIGETVCFFCEDITFWNIFINLSIPDHQLDLLYSAFR